MPYMAPSTSRAFVMTTSCEISRLSRVTSFTYATPLVTLPGHAGANGGVGVRDARQCVERSRQLARLALAVGERRTRRRIELHLELRRVLIGEESATDHGQQQNGADEARHGDRERR